MPASPQYVVVFKSERAKSFLKNERDLSKQIKKFLAVKCHMPALILFPIIDVIQSPPFMGGQ